MAISTTNSRWDLAVVMACCLGGPCVGMSVGGRWAGVMGAGVLGVAGLIPIILLCGKTKDLVSVCVGATMFSLGFFTMALDGLALALDGAFTELFVLLVSVLTILQVGFFAGLSFLIQNNGKNRWWVVPFGFVAFEGLRHMVLRGIDGSGMTMCSFGQCLASYSFFLQTVDTGGIAFLTFQTAAISTIVILAFEILRHQRTRENVVTFGSLASFVILCLVYGAWRDLTFRSSTEYGKAILLGVRPTVLRMDRLKRAVDQSKQDGQSAGWSAIFVPEASLCWTHRDNTSESALDSPNQQNLIEERRIQEAIISFSRDFDGYFVVGAWYRTTTEAPYRNCMLVLQSGKVIFCCEKQQLIPVAENKIPFAESLLASELTNTMGLNQPSTPQKPDTAEWLKAGIPFATAVCYDVFFPESLMRFDLGQAEAFGICFDESFDHSGIFKRYLMIHSQVRCVENRRSMMKCSFGGENTVIDPKGASILPAFELEDVYGFRVPIHREVTFYRVFGDWLTHLSILLIFGLVVRRCYVGCRIIRR